ncbi:hypothetical protein C8R46DRAFT_1043510 [Mycena filopes]|nr:hypothetical protein C8R46DRAFT_1043510 [Mycena filopes]
MHPLLRPRSLSTLPVSIRNAAIDAEAGSLPGWARIIKHLSNNSGPSTHKLLPLIFTALDPARIPMDAKIESRVGNERPSAATAVNIASSAIEALGFLGHAPLAVHRELWPRVWTWLQFFQLHEEYRPGSADGPPVTVTLFTALAHFLECPQISRMVHETPGTHAFVARVWQRLPVSTEGNGICSFFHFLTHCTPAGSCVEEFVEGCGDDPDVLAALVVRHFAVGVAACRAYLPQQPPAALFRRLGILSQLPWSMKQHDLETHLASAGLVKVYISAADSLLRFQDPAAGPLAFSCVHGISSLLTCAPNYYRTLPRAVKAGLIQCVRLYTENLPLLDDNPGPSALASCVYRVLPNAMMYYPVVVALAAVFSELRGELVPSSLKPSPALDEWCQFAVLAEERFRDLQYFLSPEYTRTMRACGNLQCGVIRPALEFKRWSACREQLYCSRACQVVDWQQHGHRTSCLSLRHPLFSDNDGLSKREDAFLRLILLRTYQHRKAEILGKQLAYMFEHGGATNFFAEFEYAGSPSCVISVVAVSEAEGYTVRQKQAAAAVGAKVSLHRAVVHNGVEDVAITHVLRSESSELGDGLRHLWETLDPVVDAVKIEEQVKRLSEMTIVEMHE